VLPFASFRGDSHHQNANGGSLLPESLSGLARVDVVGGVVPLHSPGAVRVDALELEPNRTDLARHRLRINWVDVLVRHPDQGALQLFEVLTDLRE
jgi:hypothetical protein